MQISLIEEAESKKKKRSINIFFPLGLDGRFTTSLCSHLFRFPLQCTAKCTVNNSKSKISYFLVNFFYRLGNSKSFVNWVLPDSSTIFFSRNRQVYVMKTTYEEAFLYLFWAYYLETNFITPSSPNYLWVDRWNLPFTHFTRVFLWSSLIGINRPNRKEPLIRQYIVFKDRHIGLQSREQY